MTEVNTSVPGDRVLLFGYTNGADAGANQSMPTWHDPGCALPGSPLPLSWWCRTAPGLVVDFGDAGSAACLWEMARLDMASLADLVLLQSCFNLDWR